MKAIVQQEAYKKSLAKYFSSFPWLLLIVSTIGTAIFLAAKFYINTKTLEGAFSSLQLANAFFYGTVITVAMFYIARMLMIKAYENSYGLLEVQEPGFFLPCIMGGWALLSQPGNITIKNNTLYFQPDRQMTPDYKFKIAIHQRIEVKTISVRYRFLSFLILGEKKLVQITDLKTQQEAVFLVPGAEEAVIGIKEAINSMLVL